MMLKALQKLTALSLFLGVCEVSFAEDKFEPKTLLAQMNQATNQLNYEIAFVQTTPVNMESLRYRHLHINGKTYAQLITLDGVPQEIVQRDGLVSYFQPNYPSFSINSYHIVDSLPTIMRINLDTLAENYDFVNIGRNRVADHVVQTIRILPKDDFRYQYLVFIDENSKLLLRSDMLDREGNLLDQFRVVNMYVGDGLEKLSHYLDSVTFPPLLSESNTQHQKIKLSWQPTWLPRGFKLVNKSIEMNESNRIESQLFSDGLFYFTVYVSESIIPDEQENAWRQGPTTIYSESKNNREITFIGQLPISTAKRIVQDIQFKP